MGEGKFHSPYGWITSEWTKEKNSFKLHVRIPVNSTANVYLPKTAASKIYKNKIFIADNRFNKVQGNSLIQIGSDEYLFEVK